ncbi:hypothetical protein AB0M43_33680 [Longispora sp. NPDC051575]|uniref:hypothetical protein n=1 Tax=Longispora sp. NPDC051575 TaxID=3154943 RepID=UPI003442090E
MIPVSPELAAAIEAPQRRPRVRLSVDWDANGHGGDDSLDDVSAQTGAVTIDRALAGELPDEVSFVEGTAAAALSADLTTGDPSSEATHAAWWFSRTNYDGPLAGKEPLGREIFADVGFDTAAGPQYVRRFTGRTRSLSVSARGRSARLAALDYRERFREVVQLPGVMAPAVGLNASWLLSYVLHAADVPPSPPARTDGTTRLWMTGHGSPQPAVSGDIALTRRRTSGPYSSLENSYGTGPFYLAPALSYFDDTSSDSISGLVRYKGDRDADGHVTGFGRYRLEFWYKSPFWVHTPVQPMGFTLIDSGPPTGDHGLPANVFVGVDTQRRLRYTRTTTDAPVVVVADAIGPTIPGSGWHFLGIDIDFTTDVVRFKVDAQPVVTVTTAATPNTAVYPGVNTMLAYAPFADLQVTTDLPTNAPWLNELPFTPAAILDKSTLELDAVTERGAREAWGLIKEIAAAEQAIVSFDELGVFRYQTRGRLQLPGAGTVKRTLTAQTSITDLDGDTSVDRVRNIISASYTPVVMDVVAGWMWNTRDLYTVPANGRLDLWVSPDRPLAEVRTSGLVAVGGPMTGGTRVSLARNPDGTSPIDGTGFIINVTYWDVGSFKFTIINNNPWPAYTANTYSAPTMAVSGRGPRIDRAVSVRARDDDSVATFGPQPFDAPGNQWVQRREAADQLAAALVADLAVPHLAVTGLSIIGDPRLQLGDLVRLIDRDGIALDGEYWLTAIRDQLDDRGYTQTIAARRAPQILRWGEGRWGIHSWGQP